MNLYVFGLCALITTCAFCAQQDGPPPAVTQPTPPPPPPQIEQPAPSLQPQPPTQSAPETAPAPAPTSITFSNYDMLKANADASLINAIISFELSNIDFSTLDKAFINTIFSYEGDNRRTNFRGIHISGQDSKRSIFKGKLIDPIFVNTRIDNTDFLKEIANGDFTDVKLTNVTFEDTVSGTFRGAEFENVKFNKAIPSGALGEIKKVINCTTGQNQNTKKLALVENELMIKE